MGDQSEKDEAGGRMWQCGGEEKRIHGFAEESREFSDANIHIYRIILNYCWGFNNLS